MIREVTHRDVDTTLQAAEASGLFAPEEIPILRAQLERSLSGESDREEFWLADFDEAGTALGAAFCAEEPMTDRVWNLLFLGVRRDRQSAGIGTALLQRVEERLRAASQRMLVIETTNGEEFEPARSFYERHGYDREGTVRDFYAQGMHKLCYRKLLETEAADGAPRS